MALYFKNDEADRLARQLAAATGESLTQAVIHALRTRLASISAMSHPAPELPPGERKDQPGCPG